MFYDQPHYLLLFVSLSLVLSIPVRFFLKKYNSVLPQNLFMGTFGLIIGLIMMTIGKNFVGISTIPADAILAICLPIYIVQVLYRIDFNIFKRCLPQAIMIVSSEVFLYLVIFGAVFKFILESPWSFTLSFLAGLVCIPIQPSHVILMFKELARYKYLGTILEAESVLICVPVFIIFDIMLITLSERISWWKSIIFFLWSASGGLLIGCISGKLTTLLMCWIYNEPQGLLCVFIGSTFFTYYLCYFIIRVSGPIATICLVCFIVNEKHRFSTEVDICLDSFWYTLNYMTENILMLILMCEVAKLAWLYSELPDIYDIVIIYFCGNVVRLVFFQLIGFFINRMAYNINVRCLLILGLSGVKGTFNMLCALILIAHLKDRYGNPNLHGQRNFPIEIAAYVFLTLLINNGSMRITLRLTGLSELSSTRRTNMNNCMKFITEKRSSVINMLRLNRYLSDANWSLVRSETIMQHPYKIKIADEGASTDDDDEDTLWNASSAICPECFKEVPFEISDKELIEMMKEAQIKILKAKKVSIIKQYETGIITRNSLEILIHIFEIMMESNQEDNVVDLSGYLKENKLLKYIAKFLHKTDTRRYIEPPRENQCHKLCYYLMMHVAYDYVIFAFDIIYSTCQLYFLYTQMMNIYYMIVLTILNAIFILDFQIKVAGYFHKTLMGFKIYFRDGWKVFDFILLILGIFDLIITLFQMVLIQTLINWTIKSLCILRCLKIFYILQPAYQKLRSVIEMRSDAASSAGYDLATALVNCCNEILDLILHIIEATKIREIYTKKIQEEKHNLVKMIDHVQKVRPLVAITMKTKQVIRIALTSMEEALNELKVSGFVDNIEYSFIYKEIFEKQKFLRNLKYVHPSPPKMIFNDVPWMANDSVTLDFLYHNVKSTRWDVGDVICKKGKKPPGILIVVTGLLNLKYTPKESTIERYYKIGNLPIVDFLSTLKINKNIEDTITSGNTMGELSLITGRPYDCDIIAETPGQAYVLTGDIIREAMKLKNDPVNGLECRLWKHATINMAIAVLMESVMYQLFTQDQIKSKLENAFMPNLRCYKMFIITEMMESVILMEGVVADYESGNILIAPVLIPNETKKLVFPRNNLYEMGYQETLLIIIPMGESIAFDIMEEEETIAELVSLPSSTCLIHSARILQRKTKTKRRRSKRRTMDTSKLPNVDFDIEANVKETLKKNVIEAKKREIARIMSKEKTRRE